MTRLGFGLRHVVVTAALLELAGCAAITPLDVITSVLSTGATCYFNCAKFMSGGGSGNTSVEVTITGAAKLNPDTGAEPAPVVVRIYELSSEKKFLAADFFPLYDDGTKTLGSDLVTSQEFELRPGQTLSFKDDKVDDDAHFIGAVAAFRDIDGSTWRASIPITPHDSNKLSALASMETITLQPVANFAAPTTREPTPDNEPTPDKETSMSMTGGRLAAGAGAG